jgi:hypothetical protein
MHAFVHSERAWRAKGSQFDRLNAAGTYLTKQFSDDHNALGRALVELHGLQDEDEKAAKATTKRNGRGFGKRHAPRASEVALSYIKNGTIPAKDRGFANQIVNEHRDQLYKFLSSKVRYEILTGDSTDRGYDNAMAALDAPPVPHKRKAPAARGAPEAKSVKREHPEFSVSDDYVDGEDDDEDDDDIDEMDEEEEEEEEEEDAEYQAKEEEELVQPATPAPVSDAFISNTVMKFIAASNTSSADELALQLTTLKVNLDADRIHNIRHAASVFHPSSSDFSNGDIFYYKLAGESWKEASVVRISTQTEYAGIVRAVVDGAETHINLAEAAYYC